MKNAIDGGKVVMTADEAAFIDRFVARRCRPHAVVMAERLQRFVTVRQMAMLDAADDSVALAAGPTASVPSGVQAPDEPVTFVFASDGDGEAPAAWRAELTVPPRATAETLLALKVTGNGVADGVFTLAGCALPLTDGAAEISFGFFLAGIKDTDVSLRRSDGETVKGRLLFF